MRTVTGRAFWGLLAGATALLAFGASAAPPAAQIFTEGTHYTRLETAMPVNMPAGKIEVREFFWYGCPHCYTLEVYIRNWNRPEAAEFVTTPALLGKNWVDHARAYYALEALGKLEELHPVLFDALHAKRQRLSTIKQLAKFFENHGIERKKFEETAASFLVNTQVKRAENLGKNYGITSVPTLVINGEYVTSPSMVGSYENFFEVVNYLVEQGSR